MARRRREALADLSNNTILDQMWQNRNTLRRDIVGSRQAKNKLGELYTILIARPLRSSKSQLQSVDWSYLRAPKGKK